MKTRRFAHPKTSRRLPPPFAALLAVILLAGTAYSHGILSENPAPGGVRFTYDDGSPLAKGLVEVYDTDGKVLGKGETDADGMYDYGKHENVGKVVVSDPHGHRGVSVIAEPRAYADSSFSVFVIVFAIAGILLCAAVWYVLNNARKKDAGERQSLP